MEQGIKVKTTRRGDLITSFSVTGHANAGPHGQDIVCAAVSAITQMVLQALIHQGVALTYGMDSGLVYCNLLDYARVTIRNEIVQVFIQEMVHALRAIKDTHPNYITFEEEVIST